MIKLLIFISLIRSNIIEEKIKTLPGIYIYQKVNIIEPSLYSLVAKKKTIAKSKIVKPTEELNVLFVVRPFKWFEPGST